MNAAKVPEEEHQGGRVRQVAVPCRMEQVRQLQLKIRGAKCAVQAKAFLEDHLRQLKQYLQEQPQ